jgi:Fe-S cluster assembly iron-binding protein IscA
LSTNLQISLSDEAYLELKKLLELNSTDYSCIRLSHYKSCCKGPSVDIYLDDFIHKDEYYTKDISGIPFIFDKDVNSNIKEIELIYKNSSLMIKATPAKPMIKDCSSCSGGHSSKKGSHSCGGCGNH